MAATDLVPCFLTGQDYRWERPALIHTRAEVREMKRLKLGKFVDNGKVFLLDKSIETKISFYDGPLGIGNLLPFSRIPNGTEKHHYPIPAMADHRIAWLKSFMAIPNRATA
jgi:hypothetical protein